MGSELDGAGVLGETELRGMQLTMGDSIRMQPMSATAHLKMARMVIVCVCVLQLEMLQRVTYNSTYINR